MISVEIASLKSFAGFFAYGAFLFRRERTIFALRCLRDLLRDVVVRDGAAQLRALPFRAVI